MYVTLFTGEFFGALLGFSTRNRLFSICKYLFGQHPALAKSICVVLVCGLALIPSLALSGVITINTTPFFWGGVWLAASFLAFL